MMKALRRIGRAPRARVMPNRSSRAKQVKQATELILQGDSEQLERLLADGLDPNSNSIFDGNVSKTFWVKDATGRQQETPLLLSGQQFNQARCARALISSASRRHGHDDQRLWPTSLDAQRMLRDATDAGQALQFRAS